MRAALPFAFACMTAAVPAAAQTAMPLEVAEAPLDAALARRAATRLAERLEAEFVYPDAGRAYARMLRERSAAGAYDRIADRPGLASRLTDDLQALAADGHLRVMLPPPRPQPGAGPNGLPQPGTPDIELTRWIAPGIAFVRFNAFPGDEATVAATRAFIAAHGDARAIIFDIRTHRGGGLAEMDAMLPDLFAAPTDLVTMDTRSAVEREHGAIIPDGPTMRRAPASADVVRRVHHVTPRAGSTLTAVPVYLLTSGYTGSAAEHFALAMKRTHRATLVGEATAGANHFGGITLFDDGLAVFMPVGRTFDPDTGKGWEGEGVAPDMAVPADRALVTVLMREGVAAAEAERLSAEVAPTRSLHRERGRPRAQTTAAN